MENEIDPRLFNEVIKKSAETFRLIGYDYNITSILHEPKNELVVIEANASDVIGDLVKLTLYYNTKLKMMENFSIGAWKEEDLPEELQEPESFKIDRRDTKDIGKP